MMPKKKEEHTEAHEASRKKILMAAFELFGKKGYSATSVESIAVKARVSKGLVYHYFKSKQDILRGIFFMLMQQGDRLMEGSEELSPKQFIKKMIDYSFEYIIGQTKFNRLLIAITIQPEVVKGLKKEIDKAKDIWNGKITAVFKKLDYAHPEEEAYLLGALLDGIGLGYLAMGTEYPVEKIKKLVEKRYDL